MSLQADFDRLVQRYVDGECSAAEIYQLNELLRSSPEARELLIRTMNLDSAIAAAAAGWMPEAVPEKPSSSPRVSSAMALRWLAAACVALLAGGGWWLQRETEIVATVQNGAGVEELANGTALHREPHVINAGSLELLTARGARVVIEAPAEFRFETAQRLHMIRGRLAAEVPPSAKGFSVITPSGDAVDLGTRFGVDVPLAGAAEIHVFQGEVIAKASGNRTRQSLKRGDAITMQKGASTATELRSAAFIQADEMAGLAAGLAAGQRARSEKALATLRSDPALIELLDFESSDSHPGVYRMTQGRWPGSKAPEFVNVGDHLKLDVGGDKTWPQLTLAAWVRLDQLGAPYQSLLHTDGWSDNNPGQVHWMVTRHNTMRLALFGNTLAAGAVERERFPDSTISVLPEQGRWVHLATVYNSQKHTVRFYLNGRFDTETRQATAYPARLGTAQIGNWDTQDRKLSGRVDELILLGRAMDDGEVRALHEAGNPYQ